MFGFHISTSLIKVEAHFSAKQDQKLLTLYGNIYVESALCSKDQEIGVSVTRNRRNSHKACLSPIYLSVSSHSTGW